MEQIFSIFVFFFIINFMNVQCKEKNIILKWIEEGRCGKIMYLIIIIIKMMLYS